MKLSELLQKLRFRRDVDASGLDRHRELTLDQMVPDRALIAKCPPRAMCTVAGLVEAARVADYRGTESFVVTLVDDSADLDLVWLGRTSIQGLQVGVALKAKGTLSQWQGTLAMIDPSYTILSGSYYE